MANKGCIPWNKGKTIKDDPRIAKLSNKASGGIQLKEFQFKKGLIPWNKNKGGYSTKWKGRKQSEATKLKISLSRRGKAMGEDNGWWNGGGCQTERHRLMGQWQYQEWRKKVFERDNYTCQECGQHGGYLQVDHIKPWSLYPDLRYELSNGRTLCLKCHQETDTWGARCLSINSNMEGGEILNTNLS